MDNDTTTDPKKGNNGLWIAFVVIVAAAGIGGWVWKSRQAAGPDPVALADVIEDKNRAIALIENSEFDESAKLLEVLVEKLPDEELPIRNLAIARLLPIVGDVPSVSKHDNPARFQELVSQSKAALEQLAKTTKRPALVPFLRAKLAIAEDNLDEAIEQIRLAMDLDRDDAAIAYGLFRVTEHQDEDVHGETALEGLKLAHARAPDNLWVMPTLLVRQAKIMDPAIKNTLAALRKHIRVFLPAIRTSLLKYLDDAEAALAIVLDASSDDKTKTLNWKLVLRNSRFINNVTRPQKPVQIDKRSIDPHLLEFVIEDFSSKIQDRQAQAAAVDSPVAVKFVAADDAQQLVGISDARAVRLVDVTLDDLPEAIVLRESALQIYKRNDAAVWELLMETAVDGMTGVLVVDLDFDAPRAEQCEDLRADVDFAVFGPAGVKLFENRLATDGGKRELIDRTPDDLGQVGEVIAAVSADLDHDSDLDFMLLTKSGVQVWSNSEAIGGGGKRRTSDFFFIDITDRSHVEGVPATARNLFAVDWNLDLSIDVLVSGAAGDPLGVLESLRHGQFRWKEIKASHTGPVCIGDFDQNATWDLLTSSTDGIHLTPTISATAGVVRLQDAKAISETKVANFIVLDYDNDGYVDCLGYDGTTTELLRGGPTGGIHPVADVLPVGFAASHLDCGDLDGDGDLDLLAVANGKPTWFRNDGGNANHWIDFRLNSDPLNEQYPANHVNMHGIGATLEIKAGGLYQKQTVGSRTTHFGLGKHESVEIARVVWTDGVPFNTLDIGSNGNICVKQVMLGSCPYIYTWDGERYAFLTDGLWNAPIGLQFAEGVLAPTREWEYLTIPEGRLKPVDGEYRLQFTEELFEAVYFEEIKLFSVAHPKGVRIFTNEKVGPASIAEHKIHTVTNPRTPVSAKNHVGRDLLPLISTLDNRFARVFEKRIMRGRTEDYYLELNLGRLDAPRQLKLFLTGWMLPSGTSTNIALSQDRRLGPGQPPSIAVPDRNGEWRTVIPFMGFPGGKTKTIVVDLSDTFPSDDYRLRIHCNMEINWDHIFFTMNDPDAETRIEACPLTSANLHHRGFSRRIPSYGFPTNNGPENYIHGDVSVAEKWPPMFGRFTRFGNVTELIRDSDDRLVVMGAGDEMTVRFAEPTEPLPDGWTRSFVLYNVGWDKDADANTVLGSTVEPLPFRGMTGYPFDPEEATPDSESYRKYVAEYQTREQSHREFLTRIRRYQTASGK
ncbi:MAG: hypothetical protein O3A00_06435 [Planctomycetota bacterium]|nr:hypothetical protein [Planctomycetota bacterium]